MMIRAEKFRRDEDILPLNVSLGNVARDGVANFVFRHVTTSAVEMTISDLDGLVHKRLHIDRGSQTSDMFVWKYELTSPYAV